MTHVNRKADGIPARYRMSDRQKAVILNWLAAYPVITILLAVLDPILPDMPLPLRTLLVTVIMVPAMVYLVMPIVRAKVQPLLDKDAL